MQKRQVETDEPATLRISGNALHLSDGVGVTLLDDQIVLENRATGASKAFSREAIPLLDLFMDWIEPDDFVSRAFEQGGEAESVNRAIGVLHDLLELDVLTVRAEDLRGTRLRALVRAGATPCASCSQHGRAGRRSSPHPRSSMPPWPRRQPSRVRHPPSWNIRRHRSVH